MAKRSKIWNELKNKMIIQKGKLLKVLAYIWGGKLDGKYSGESVVKYSIGN